MTYKAYLLLANGKKLWINKEFASKIDAQRELRIAKKEIGEVIGIKESGIVSTAPAKPKSTKPASKPASKSAPKSAPKDHVPDRISLRD